MQIGEKTLKEGKSLLDGLIDKYREDINLAYLKAAGPLTIDLKLKFSPDDGGNKIEAGISFVTDKVKDSVSGKMDEDQMDLEFENREEEE